MIFNTTFHNVLREKRGGGATLTDRETEREQRQEMLKGGEGQRHTEVRHRQSSADRWRPCYMHTRNQGEEIRLRSITIPERQYWNKKIDM